MTRQQKLVLIIVGVLAVIGVIIGIFAINRGDSTVITDRDTGETLDLEPEFRQETGGVLEDSSPVTLFGLINLSEEITRINNSSTGPYFDTIKLALWDYSENRLDDSYTTLTIRPQDLQISGTTITTSVRLGQTDEILPISITVSDDKSNAITTINEGGDETQHGGKYIYVSGFEDPQLLFTIQQKDDSTSDLVINAYSGYKESALKYIESLGYNVPDFTITFEEYENPFI